MIANPAYPRPPPRRTAGPTTPDVRRSILRPTLRAVGAGLVAGVVVALLASRWIESQPIGVTGASLTTHLTVAVVVAVAAVLATVRPSRRASRINPAMTLRAE
jgi:ABC-type lipoprotein release transport system permease subunit